MSKRLIIVPDGISKEILEKIIDNSKDIVLSVSEIFNKEYTKYDIDRISYHQYPIVKEQFEQLGTTIEQVSAEIMEYIKNTNPDFALEIDNMKFVKLFNGKNLIENIRLIARDLNPDIVLGILKGCNPFMTYLLQYMNKKDIIVDYCQVSSYKGGLEAQGQPEFKFKPNKTIYKGKDKKKVLIVDDIFDSGMTIKTVIKELFKYNKDLEIEVYVLVSNKLNPEIKVKDKTIPVRYIVNNTSDKFLIGFGLDYKEMYRNLNHIYALLEDG